MRLKFGLLLLLLFINTAFSQIYKIQAKDDSNKVIEGKWVLMPEAELKEHQVFKEGAEMKTQESIDMEGGLKKQITTWKRDNIIRTETRIYDPRKIVAQKGYLPVDVIYVTIHYHH
jgi:hypothetical protein